jgi:hypothetical protein
MLTSVAEPDVKGGRTRTLRPCDSRVKLDHSELLRRHTRNRGTVVLVRTRPDGRRRASRRAALHRGERSFGQCGSAIPFHRGRTSDGHSWCRRALSSLGTGSEWPHEGFLRPDRSSPIDRQPLHPAHLWIGLIERASRHRPRARAFSRPRRQAVARSFRAACDGALLHEIG